MPFGWHLPNADLRVQGCMQFGFMPGKGTRYHWCHRNTWQLQERPIHKKKTYTLHLLILKTFNCVLHTGLSWVMQKLRMDGWIIHYVWQCPLKSQISQLLQYTNYCFGQCPSKICAKSTFLYHCYGNSITSSELMPLGAITCR